MAIALLAAVVAGCGIRPGSSSGPTSTPLAIEHPTDPASVILRLDEGGGFVPPSFFVTEGPAFSLYGDGTLILRNPASSRPPDSGTVAREVPYRTARLDEAQIQALLAAALGPGGLRTAREHYVLPVADAPTTTFTVVAEGRTWSVSVNGLGVGAETGADAAALAALAKLRDQLLGFGDTLAGAQPWSPERYRAFLIEPFATTDLGSVLPWPWPAISPSSFLVPTEDGLPRWPMRVLTRSDVAALGLTGLEGGARGIYLRRPGQASGEPPLELAIRPLLPDEVR